MTKYRLLVCLSAVFLFISCTDNGIIDDNLQGNLNADPSLRNLGFNFELKDGRLYFPTQEILQETHQSLSQQDDEAIYEQLKPLYFKGFIPLRPIIPEDSESESDLAIQIEQMNKRTDNITASELSAARTAAGINDDASEEKYEQIANLIDNTDEIVGDDIFATLLNYLGEIQIGNQIYKYTDVGMFSTSENNKEKIDFFLEKNKISSNPIIPTEHNNRMNTINRFTATRTRATNNIIDNGISYFISSFYEEEHEIPELKSSRVSSLVSVSRTDESSNSRGSAISGGNRGGSISGSRPSSTIGGSRGEGNRKPGGSTVGRPGSIIGGNRGDVIKPERPGGVSGNRGEGNKGGDNTTTDEVQRYLESISDCNPKSGIFGSLFGKNQVCKNRYEKKRRVKIKAFCYDYGIIYHVGTKVKHQKKGKLGLWRTSKAPYIEMGVEYAQFTYDYSKMIGASIAQAQKAQKIAFEGKQYTNYSSIGMPGLEVKSFNIKSYPTLFRNDIVIEQFGIGVNLIDQAIKEGIKSGNKALTSKKLNEYFWKALWSSTNNFLSDNNSSNLQNNKNRTLLVKLPELGKILVQKSYNSSGNNLGVRSKTLDWGFIIGINANPENGWSLSGDLSGSSLIKPKNFKCSMYGVVRGSDGKLHGVKMSF